MKNISSKDLVILSSLYKGVTYGSEEHVLLEGKIKGWIGKYGFTLVLNQL